MPIDLAALPAPVMDELARAGAGRLRATGREVPPLWVTYAGEGARVADFVDHTLLKPEATRRDVEQLCAEAGEHRFAAVCVNPTWVPLCRDVLAGSRVKVATVVSFPLGASRPEVKAAEAALAVRDGAQELDVVAAIGLIKSGDWDGVARDVRAVLGVADGTLVKVIIECAALTPIEIVRASTLARDAGAHYVKTSTGFHPAGGATEGAVALMRLAVGDALGVKASGGVRDCKTALRMIAAGATRIGTSSGVAMAECRGLGPRPVRELNVWRTFASASGTRNATAADALTETIPPGD
jgi:deoxyribose-phosphate aldolase